MAKKPTINFHIISLFPDVCSGYFEQSIIGKAVNAGHVAINYQNPMNFCEDSVKGALPKRVDAKPYGGGPGMVIRVEPVIRAIQAAVGRKKNVLYVHFAPRAGKFTNKEAQNIVKKATRQKTAIKDVVFICGRYEGVDSRIVDMFPGAVYSIGDYVLTGGELPAMVMVDAVTRHVPGVLGDSDSVEENRDAAGLYYAKPETVIYKKKKYSVPEVLRSGNHAEIEKWRKKNK